MVSDWLYALPPWVGSRRRAFAPPGDPRARHPSRSSRLAPRDARARTRARRRGPIRRDRNRPRDDVEGHGMGAGVFMRSRGKSSAVDDEATTEPTTERLRIGTPPHPPSPPSAALGTRPSLYLRGARHAIGDAGRSFASPRPRRARATSRERRRRPGRRRRPRRRRPPPDARARRERERSGRGVVVASASAGVARVVRAPVLEAALRETLRLHPVAPLVVRKLTTDAVGEDVTLPAGCAAGVWLHAVHRDETAWENPDAFALERWLTTAEERRRETERRRSAKGTRRESLDVGDGAAGAVQGVGVHAVRRGASRVRGAAPRVGVCAWCSRGWCARTTFSRRRGRTRRIR